MTVIEFPKHPTERVSRIMLEALNSVSAQDALDALAYVQATTIAERCADHGFCLEYVHVMAKGLVEMHVAWGPVKGR